MQSSSCRSPTASLYSVSLPKSRPPPGFFIILRYFPHKRKKKDGFSFCRRALEPFRRFPRHFPTGFRPFRVVHCAKEQKEAARWEQQERGSCGSGWRRDWRRGPCCARRCARSERAASALCWRARGFYRRTCRWRLRRCACCRSARRLCARISGPWRAMPCSGAYRLRWSRSRRAFWCWRAAACSAICCPRRGAALFRRRRAGSTHCWG